jgi:hypothetical protein
MVTAELAVALPVLAVVLAGCLAVMSAVSMQLRCEDAAGLAARAAARGDPVALVAAAATAAVPGAVLQLTQQGDVLRATVTATTHPFGTAGPSVPVSASAAALSGIDAAAGLG